MAAGAHRDAGDGPDHNLDLAADLSIAFLTLLERLAPEERAAVLMHDVFDVGYGEIASVLDRSEAACRQLTHRARQRVRGERNRLTAVLSIATDGERILTVYTVVNPEKLLTTSVTRQPSRTSSTVETKEADR